MGRLRVWTFVLLEYDEFGNATVLRAFNKIAKDSEVRQTAKKKTTKPKKMDSVVSGEKVLF